jgi:hypothetical protein
VGRSWKGAVPAIVAALFRHWLLAEEIGGGE